jgi:hypothetical protein
LAARIGGRSAWERATLAALGYWWLAITEALTGRRLLLGAVSDARPRTSWQTSVPDVISHVLAPLCTPDRLAPALLWALAAVLLPWLLRHSSGATRAILAASWAVALVVASLVLAHRIGAPSPPLPLAAAALAAAVAWSLRRQRFRSPARPDVA